MIEVRFHGLRQSLLVEYPAEADFCPAFMFKTSPCSVPR